MQQNILKRLTIASEYILYISIKLQQADVFLLNKD